MTKVVLREYLSRLQAIETLKARGEKKKYVPSLAELADLAGLHRGSIFRIAGNKGNSIHFKTANAIIQAMRNQGFDMELSDLVIYEEGSKEA